ncbi:hypothetical protein [Bradyrhizobium sp. NAS80.1]|uniref:hypothetical protein n=1 Tax=Bradyrhizobium sp. NAS80.1 TaxID=1680159 RepID=UPI001AEFD877|nr:hypothetical protein [Bradyrhizobium sp. NAS80.1]
MGEFIAQHAAAIWSFLAGLAGGGITGSFITYRMTSTKRASNGGALLDQSGSVAGGDIVGRDKRS